MIWSHSWSAALVCKIFITFLFLCHPVLFSSVLKFSALSHLVGRFSSCSSFNYNVYSSYGCLNIFGCFLQKPYFWILGLNSVNKLMNIIDTENIYLYVHAPLQTFWMCCLRISLLKIGSMSLFALASLMIFFLYLHLSTFSAIIPRQYHQGEMSRCQEVLSTPGVIIHSSHLMSQCSVQTVKHLHTTI